MNPFISIWFWLLVLSIIGFILSFIFFETMSNPNPPAWIWVLFVLSIIFFIIAFIIYCVDLAAYYHRLEIAEACGELPPPKPKKVVVCPPKCPCLPPPCPPPPCQLPAPKPCPKPCPPEVIEVQPQVQYQVITQTLPQTVPLEVQPINIVPDYEQAFAAAGVRPLTTLAPI